MISIRLICTGNYKASFSMSSLFSIFSYDLASEKLIKIYNHNAPCRCVAASMDSNESILAITTLETREKDGVSQDYFKSSLAEILPSGESYRLNVRSQLVQRVQFINSKTTLFLFMIEGMFIRLYQMHSRKRMAGGVKIVAQPVLLSEITKKFKWYDWCSRTQRLFVLSSVRKHTHSPLLSLTHLFSGNAEVLQFSEEREACFRDSVQR